MHGIILTSLTPQPHQAHISFLLIVHYYFSILA